jgi:ATP-grasp domain-containing protein
MIRSEGKRSSNALLVAFALTLPYHVLRTAAAAGLRVHVLGSGAADGLRRTRFCRGYHRSRCGGDAERLLTEISELVRLHRIDVVLPSDDVSTRLLAELSDRLPVPTTPLPDVATFDLLNDKWSFTQFCYGHGISAPQGWLFDTAAGLCDALAAGQVELPLTVKPTNRSGGVGVLHVRAPEDIALLDAIDYRPVLAQRHITGESVSITLLCEQGRVRAHVAQQRDTCRFQVLTHPDLLDNASRLAALSGYHGITNFDAVIADDGRAYLVECNPRFWYSIYLVMLAGLNFVQLALHKPSEVATLHQGEMRLSWRRILARPWRASRADWRFLFYNLRDPLAYLLLRRGAYDDSDVAVPVGRMAGPLSTAIFPPPLATADPAAAGEMP